jgi:hypothetical protein
MALVANRQFTVTINRTIYKGGCYIRVADTTNWVAVRLGTFAESKRKFVFELDVSQLYTDHLRNAPRAWWTSQLLNYYTTITLMIADAFCKQFGYKILRDRAIPQELNLCLILTKP